MDEIGSKRIDWWCNNQSQPDFKEGDFIQAFYDICELVDGPVSAETIAQDTEGMVRQGEAACSNPHRHKTSINNGGLAAYGDE